MAAATEAALQLTLPTPDRFSAFPYDPPYDIQVDLMRHLYSSIELSKVAIVESPTGTGKTLSLLTSSLTWLTDDRERARRGELAATGPGSGIDWITEQTLARRRRELEAEDAEYEERLRKAKRREMQRRKDAARVKRLKYDRVHDINHETNYDRFLPEGDAQTGDDEDDNLSPAVRAMMAKMNKGTQGKRAPEEADPTCTKIYYASRTHSQLSQVIPELSKLKLPFNHNSMLSTSRNQSDDIFFGKRPHSHMKDDIETYYTPRTVALGSRKQLCINDKLKEKVQRRDSPGDLDEACRELLNEKGDKRCPYLPKMVSEDDEDAKMRDFRDEILASPKDIEDLATAGREAHTCPYFGSRRAIPQAELVTLPYNLLLSKSSRDALGIDLTGQIVIIDEAHNLISTLLSLSAVSLDLSIIAVALQQVKVYYTKFRSRLATKHLLHIKRLVEWLKALHEEMVKWRDERKTPETNNRSNGQDAQTKSNTGASEILDVQGFVSRLGRKVEGINLIEVEEYLRTSKIARKISGYNDHLSAASDAPKHARRSGTPPLHAIESFMLALTSAKDDGRVAFHAIENDGVEIRYQQLNPETHFRDIVDTARSVVLAGGTMSPMSDFVNQLFVSKSQEEISMFSCGHIIPADNITTVAVGKGPRGGAMQFNMSNQSDPELIAELGQCLANFVNVIPHGIVVFFPSYKFLNAVKTAWLAPGGVLEKISKKKKVFYEPQDGSSVDSVLEGYSLAARTSINGIVTGAILLAVVGAKLSEGLNFSDDLARAVVVVGMPYANLGSPELRERMKYIKNRPNLSSGRNNDPAQEYYENMCMNAINQSIGRAIRHQNDWAALILVDARYRSEKVSQKLPGWIAHTKNDPETFGQAISELGRFFRLKKAR